MPICKIDLSVGGAYRYVWHKEGVSDMGLGGVFQEIVSPERIVATERFDESWYPGDALDTTVFVETGPLAGPVTSMTLPYFTDRRKRATPPAGPAWSTGWWQATTGWRKCYRRCSPMAHHENTIGK